MVIFNSYVKLPEGSLTTFTNCGGTDSWQGSGGWKARALVAKTLTSARRGTGDEKILHPSINYCKVVPPS